MKVINLTPHDVNICDENGHVTKLIEQVVWLHESTMVMKLLTM